MSTAPGYVVLHLYHPKNKKHEQYHALVLSSREVEDHKNPLLTVVYFNHINTAAHHALQGVDWAETLERVMDVPSIEDKEGAPFFYDDQLSTMHYLFQRYSERCGQLTSDKQLLVAELEVLKAELANTTEGRDKALQALADEHARTPFETKRYADGSSAAGPGPLPDHSPDGAPAIESTPTAADLDAVADEEKAKEATS